jgi:hypothetical protein
VERAGKELRQVQDGEKIARAYARLVALRKNLDGERAKGNCKGLYAHEFNEALRDLKASGFDVREFRIRQEQFRTTQIQGEFVVDAVLLLTRIDAVLVLFELRGPEKPPLGFRGGKA